MQRYRMNELDFEWPAAGLADRTVHELTATLRDGSTLAVLVVRQPLAGTNAFEAAVEAQERREAARLFGHRSLERIPCSVAGLRGLVVAARWTHQTTELYTRTLHLALPGQRIAISANAPIAHRALVDKCIDEAARTIRFDA